MKTGCLFGVLVLVAAGTGFAEDGSIVAWGANGYGQCDVPSPNEDFVAVTTGENHNLGLKQDGSIVAWGNNTHGQCDVPEQNEGFVAVAGGGVHTLGLKFIDTGMENTSPTGVFQILSIAPNPFSMSSSIVFHSPGVSQVGLEVYDTAGRLVRTQDLGSSPAGQHSVSWDGRDASGAELSPGIYFIRLVSAEEEVSAKVVIMR